MIEQLRHAKTRQIDSISALLCLLILNQESPATHTWVARQIGFSTAALTGLKDKLVRAGLVIERHGDQDRRVKFMELTADGKALVHEILVAQKAVA